MRKQSVDQEATAASTRGRSAWRLWLYGIGMLLPLTYFAWRYPLYGNSNGLTDLGKLARYGRGEFVWFAGGVLVLFALYVLALRESRRVSAQQAFTAVFGCGAAMAYAMTWMYPVSAIDVYFYALRSRLWTTYGANPISALFKDYPNDAWAHLAHAQWAQVASPYGPMWNLISAPITYLAGDRILLALLGFKLLTLICLIMGAAVIFRTLRARGSTDAVTGAMLYLWNPLVLWETVGNGHNDVVMTLPLLLALLAWVKRRDALVIPLLVIAALIKYVPLLLIPIAAIALWRRAEGWPARLRRLWWSAALSVLVVGISLYPFYDLAAVQSSVAHQGNILRMSPPAMAFSNLSRHYDEAQVKHWIRLIGAGLLLATLVWQAVSLWRRPSRLPRACFEVMYVFLVVATWYFNGWYLVWLVGLAAVLPWGWPAWRMIAWTAGSLAFYGLAIWIEAWWQPTFYALQNTAVVLMFGGTLLLTLAEIAVRIFHDDHPVAGGRRGFAEEDEPGRPRQGSVHDVLRV